MPDQPVSANPGYAAAQRDRALRTLAEHPDPQTRARAAAKIARWEAVLEGMAFGGLEVGSRTPVEGAPAWATLEVVHGGFATGRLAAEVPLDEDERAMLATLPPGREGETDRARLNQHALTLSGMAELLTRLEDGRYRVDLPEEGALGVVAWLLDRGATEAARGVLASIGPWLHRLRFTPRPVDHPMTEATSVSRASVAEVAQDLHSRGGSARVAAMGVALRVFNPLTDEAIALVLETVDGDPPQVETDPQGVARRDPGGQPRLIGGRPFARSPEGWAARAEDLLRRVTAARVAHPEVRRGPRTTLGVLEAGIRRVLDPAAPAPAADPRRVLAGAAHKRGPVGSELHALIREEQAAIAARPSNLELARVLARRLDRMPAEGGLADPEAVSGPVLADELPSATGWPLPPSLLGRLGPCLEAPIEELMARGVVPSAEVLAELLPKITAQVLAAGIQDPALRRLYGAIYAAFRRRRTLLLLNLERQVGIDELPWVSALDPFRDRHLGAAARARQTLEQVAGLAIAGFPQTILPNPLVSEMASLSEAAHLGLPLVEELAADIFMGTFTPKFEAAAVVAARLLEGRIYAQYYDLPGPGAYAYAPGGERHGKKTAEGFAARCVARAKEAGGGSGRSVAANGTVLEQAQILHTHNLAVLFEALGLTVHLGPRLPELARACFTWILDRQSTAITDPRAQLQRVKNQAYAWRQMLFFLSLGPVDALEPFFLWARGVLDGAAAKEPSVRRLGPALDGLEHIARGGRFDPSGRVGQRGRRLLGWTVGRHWMLG